MKKLIFILCAVLPSAFVLAELRRDEVSQKGGCRVVAHGQRRASTGASTMHLEADCIRQLTMEDAVQMSLKHRPDLEALRYATQASKSGAKAAIAGYYPTITVGSTFSQNDNQVAPTNLTELDVKQTIFSFAGPQEKYRVAKKLAEVSELDEDIRAQEIRLAAESAFLEAFYVQERACYIQALSCSSEASFKLASAENKLQRTDKDAWLDKVETFATNLKTIQQFDVKLDQAYRKLEFLTGQTLLRETTSKTKKGVHTEKERAQLVWQHKKKIVLEKLESYYTYALANRPEIKQYAKRAEMEHATMRLAQGSRLPLIGASAQVMFDESKSVVDPESQEVISGKTSWNYSIGLNWTIFDGMVQQHAERQARANRMKEILNKQQAILTIKQAVQDLYSELLSKLLELQAKKIKYVHARNTFKLSSQKYELGKIAGSAFKTAETAWKDVQLEWILSNVAVALAEQTLIRACGYPAALG
jgi:outer membrane protein TolC